MGRLRNCILCGTQYEYCPRCDDTKPTYFLKYCSENCKTISLILNQYSFKHLTKEQAIEELNKCDLSKLKNFEEKEKTYIESILKVDDVVEPIDDKSESIDEDKEEIKEDEPKEVEEQPKAAFAPKTKRLKKK